MLDLTTPIDFEKAARRQLVVTHGEQIRVLLGATFDALEAEGVHLSAFGFASTPDAVEWTVDKFANRDFDPARLPRTWKLFTQGRFWLSQRYGGPAYKRIINELRTGTPSRTPRSATSTVSADVPEELVELRQRTAAPLQALNALVRAPGLTADWLRATQRLRRHWLIPLAEPSTAMPARSKKDRSFRHHDAMFRYQCVAHGLPKEDHEDHVVLRAWLFSPAPDEPPFRCRDLSRFGTTPVVQERQREGVTQCLMIIADEVDTSADSPWEKFRRAHAAFGVTPTTLHLFSLDGREDEATMAVRTIGRHPWNPFARHT